MSNPVTFDRRRLLYGAAAGVATKLMPVSAAAAQGGQAKSASIVNAGTNTSFASLKQIDAGELAKHGYSNSLSHR
jgi:uncharacterized protein (DUF1501 family)